MSKLEALQYLQTLGTFEGAAAEAIGVKLSEKVKVAKRAEVRVAVAPTKAKQAEAAADPVAEQA